MVLKTSVGRRAKANGARTPWARAGRDITGEGREQFSVTGTFNALVAGRLGAGGPAERTAKASEETAKHAKKTAQNTQRLLENTPKFG